LWLSRCHTPEASGTADPARPHFLSLWNPSSFATVAGAAHDASFFRGGGGGYGDEMFDFENYECHLTGGPNRSRVVAELKRVVLKQLAELHCTVLDSMPSSDQDELGDFVIEYAWRGRRGSVVVASFSEPDDEFCVLMTRHEATVAQ
jgi:hypothetical protein